MCNVIERVNAMRPHLQGRSSNNIFHPIITQNHPYQRIQVGHCINTMCGRPMNGLEMYPPDRQTARSMCPTCYAAWAGWLANDYYPKCWICGGELEAQKVAAFRANPNEVSNRLHDGQCLDYFSLLSCKALGQDMSFLADEHMLQAPPQFQHSASHPSFRHDSQIAGHTGQHTRLPPPQPQATIPYQFQRPKQPQRPTYKGKPIKIVN